MNLSTSGKNGAGCFRLARDRSRLQSTDAERDSPGDSRALPANRAARCLYFFLAEGFPEHSKRIGSNALLAPVTSNRAVTGAPLYVSVRMTSDGLSLPMICLTNAAPFEPSLPQRPMPLPLVDGPYLSCRAV
jgi:hypothetical protein